MFLSTYSRGSALRVAAVALVSFASVAQAITPHVRAPGDSAACASSLGSGIYRIAIVKDGRESTAGVLLLERASGCMSATLVSEQMHTTLSGLVVTEDGITGSLQTEQGKVAVKLHFSAEGVDGTIGDGKAQLAVHGTRTG
ncbi:MAG: hypothetical protein JWO05_1885 [Gemmatimonadetes bacterium]|nr:hypothetical protein [Gemmatimonadota bacterium]